MVRPRWPRNGRNRRNARDAGAPKLPIPIPSLHRPGRARSPHRRDRPRALCFKLVFGSVVWFISLLHSPLAVIGLNLVLWDARLSPSSIAPIPGPSLLPMRSLSNGFPDVC